MRDAPRKNPRDYRKEEWIAYGLDAREVDVIARRHARGRFFVCAMLREGEPDQPARTAYKALGYPELIAVDRGAQSDAVRLARCEVRRKSMKTFNAGRI
jgi:hypothetical protein